MKSRYHQKIKFKFGFGRKQDILIRSLLRNCESMKLVNVKGRTTRDS